MTQEEKELLLKVLCFTYPYGVRVAYLRDLSPCSHDVISINRSGVKISGMYCGAVCEMWVGISAIKPYLRPMSSMTEEEKAEYDSFNAPTAHRKVWLSRIDWLLSKHFDLRGLIPLGLALPAPESMYNIK